MAAVIPPSRPGRTCRPGPDCEARRRGLPAEPANAVSSLAFLPAAAVVAARAIGAPRPDARWAGALAAALAANGAGSAWYHARVGPASRWAHDSAVTALLVLLAAGGTPALARGRAAAGAVAASAALHAVRPGAGPALQGTAVAAVAAALARDALARRRWRGGPARHGRRLAAAALVAGGACWAAGRPGRRWCRPCSALQPHAAWHVLGAVAAAAAALEVAEPAA